MIDECRHAGTQMALPISDVMPRMVPATVKTGPPTSVNVYGYPQRPTLLGNTSQVC